jgi:hypothetical protein
MPYIPDQPTISISNLPLQAKHKPASHVTTADEAFLGDHKRSDLADISDMLSPSLRASLFIYACAFEFFLKKLTNG